MNFLIPFLKEVPAGEGKALLTACSPSRSRSVYELRHLLFPLSSSFLPYILPPPPALSLFLCVPAHAPPAGSCFLCAQKQFEYKLIIPTGSALMCHFPFPNPSLQGFRSPKPRPSPQKSSAPFFIINQLKTDSR